MTTSDVCRKQIMDLIFKAEYSKRKSLHMSQVDVASLMDRTRNCIQQIEYREHLPDFETFFLLDEALHFSDDEAISLFLEIRACVRADMKRQREEAGTYQLAVSLWGGKQKGEFAHI